MRSQTTTEIINPNQVEVQPDNSGLFSQVTGVWGINASNADLGMAQVKIKELVTRLAEVENSSQQKMAEIKEKHEQEIKQEIAKKNDIINRLENEVKQSEGTIDELADAMTELGNEIQELEQQNVDLRNKVDDLNNEISNLNSQKGENESKISQLNNAIEKLNEDLKNLNTQHNTEINGKNATIADKEKEIQKKQEELEDLQSKNTDIQKKIENLEKEKSSVELQLENTQAELEQAKAELQQKEEEVNSLKQEMQTQKEFFDKQIESLNQRMKEQEQNFEQAKQKLTESLKHQMDSLQALAGYCQITFGDNDSFDIVMEKIQKYIEDLKRQLAEKIEQLEKERDVAQNALAKSQDLNAFMMQHLQENNVKLEEVTRQINEFDDKLNYDEGRTKDNVHFLDQKIVSKAQNALAMTKAIMLRRQQSKK